MESGLRNHRVEFVREETDDDANPVTPENPDFLTYSDVVRSFDWQPEPNYEAQRGFGHVYPHNHFTGSEEHQVTMTYDLQKFPVDGAGDPLDAVADGLLRDDDGFMPHTHTVLDREDKGTVAPASTVNGDEPRATRLYTIVKGAAIDEPQIIGDPGEQQPVRVELTYEAESGRSYQVDQPDEGTTLDLEIVDGPGGETVDVTIEDEGGSNAEVLEVSGTTATSANTYEDVDTIELAEEIQGDVHVSETDGVLLAVIHGSDYYDGAEGDLGIPALGDGSREGELGTPFQLFLGNEFNRERGGVLQRFAMDINSFAVGVENNTERTLRTDSKRQRIHHGIATPYVEATVLGETETHDSLTEAMGNEAGDVEWVMSGGTVTVADAVLAEPGSRAIEAEEATMTMDNTFHGENLTITAN